MTLLFTLFACCAAPLSLGAAAAQAQADANKLVTLNEIQIVGSRLPEAGVLRLSGLTVGEQVNDATVNLACHNITSTGLVKKIDYAYNVYPDKESVALVLTLVDEKPLLPATISPKTEEEQLWRVLEAAEPLLTKELPRTERALTFYTSQMEKALKSQGRDNQYVAATVMGDANGTPSGIVFTIRSYKQLRSVAKP